MIIYAFGPAHVKFGVRINTGSQSSFPAEPTVKNGCRSKFNCPFRIDSDPVHHMKSIDLFTDTAAIVRCPGGTRSVFARAFRAEENFNVYFWEKGDHYYIQIRRNDLFFTLQFFSRKT